MPTGGNGFVLRDDEKTVKTPKPPGNVSGLDAFVSEFSAARPLMVGTSGVLLEAWMQGV